MPVKVRQSPRTGGKRGHVTKMESWDIKGGGSQYFLPSLNL